MSLEDQDRQLLYLKNLYGDLVAWLNKRENTISIATGGITMNYCDSRKINDFNRHYNNCCRQQLLFIQLKNKAKYSL
ncbi:MAG: hypothetical protein A4E52_01451 [Pelotomaculum sp. PtaB.Bin013]|nr:MAG: hypothetical protein A4E52_01451 [Pelotomaculum sp. PtaB.Bin013]